MLTYCENALAAVTKIQNMVGKKWQRRIHALTLFISLSVSIFYSYTVIRRSFNVCKNWSRKKMKTSDEIVGNCTEIRHGKCKNNHAITLSTQRSSWEKYVMLGKLKQNKGILTVGYIHTENCGKSENLERSLGSLFSNLKKAQQDEISVIVLLRDCPEVTTKRFLDNMHSKYKYWSENKVLQFVKIPENFKIRTDDKNQYWENFTSHSSQYIKKAKSLIRNIAFLWKFSASQSDYFIQFTDHVKVEGNLLSCLTFTKNWTTNNWLWAETFRGFITGSIYKTESFKEFTEFFDIFGSYMPFDLMLTFYRVNMRISRRVYEISKPLPLRQNFQFNGDNPEAVLTTSLVPGGGVSLQDLYNYRKDYFWAWPPKEGDFILINFKSFVQVKRVIIETGTFLYKDVFPGGVVSVIFGDTSVKTPTMCHEKERFEVLAEFGEPSVEITGRTISSAAIGCIKIEVNPVKSKVFDSWVIVRTIAIFT